MSTDEKKDNEEMEKELAFFRNQTKVLREKNRDLRNALLIAESDQGSKEPKEATQESLSDIRQIIADSKKQITEKLQQFKETIDEDDPKTTDSTPTDGESSKTGVAPSAPKYDTKMDAAGQPSTDGISTSTEIESLAHQVDYLKKEIDRNETFLEQSEMVNNRLRQLLVEHNIDLSEISKAINEASKTAISPTAIKKEDSKPAVKEPEQTPAKTATPPKKEAKTEQLDPAIAKVFTEFKGKIGGQISEDDIKMEILEFREKLMDMIPHSRVFYEMQVEYRKWKRGISSVKGLQDAIKAWEKTIADMME
ncbi:MAG: hypothetical protein ACTSQK_00805 [Candidatus Heimdallarchaeota archaeon]